MRPSVSKSGMGGSGHEPEHASVMGSILSSGLTTAFSRSQPIDSLYRRTSSRFCCKALLCVPISEPWDRVQ
jgi:hypothetical protein